MSRLILKNLPLSITDVKLRTICSSHGDVTDLQLKYNKLGKFRGFGFVGFKDEKQAEKAREWLDDTYIGAAKIKVELCKDLGSEDKNKVEEKVSNVKTVREVDTGIDKYKDDLKFQEFSKAITGNETAPTVVKEVVKDSDDGEDEGDDEAVEEVSDLDYLKTKTAKKEKKSVELFTVKITGIPYKCKKKDIKMLFGPTLKPKSVRVPPKIKGIAFAGFATEKEQKQAFIKNKSFIGQNQIQVVKYVGKEQKQETEEAGAGGRWAEQEKALVGTETIGESGRIFVRNLSYGVTEPDLEELFGKFGPLTETR